MQSLVPQVGPLIYEPARKIESEEEKIVRYERVIDTLRKQMENERRLLKAARTQLNRDISQKTELEVLLKQAVDKVMSERKAHKKQTQQRVYTCQPGLGVTSQKVAGIQSVSNDQMEAEQDLTQHERERVIELMLSQERVISLLYDKTFHMTQVQDQGANAATQQDIDHLRRQQQEMAWRQQQDQQQM